MAINLQEPRTMLALVERMVTPKTFLRDTFFKNTEISTTDLVDVDFVKGNRKLAPFVHPKIGGKVVENSGYQTMTFKPPLVAPDKVTTAFDLMKRTAGEHIYSGKTPQQRAGEKLVRDLAELDDMITRREEAMCAQALFTGQIEVIGEGLDHVIEFGFSNKETLSGTDRWNDPSADPIKDLKRWIRQVQIKGMLNPDMVVMSSDVSDAFIRNETVQKLLNIRNLTVGEVRTARELPDGVSYIGTLTGLGLDIYEYNEYFLDDFTDENNPVTKPIVPEGTVTLLSSRANYTMAYGAITLIDKDSGAFVTYEAKRVPDQWVEKRPDRQFLALQSRPLPIPREVDSWFVAKVL
ncbi:phage capsid protein [Sporosarcina luteola]|uniref:Phage capsid protein n=1 Tax=Sporosarcina luteola TaxID=582850 RepID=A0A511Z851_9BACL|nr:major capsid protein [Sporosarcina luteola]GEN83622.1 phage capsid protein [Sporosarcina luteola]